MIDENIIGPNFDETPSHNSKLLTDYDNQSIRTHGVRWPAISPDLTSLDYFLWRYLKDGIYHIPVIDLEDLKI